MYVFMDHIGLPYIAVTIAALAVCHAAAQADHFQDTGEGSCIHGHWPWPQSAVARLQLAAGSCLICTAFLRADGSYTWPGRSRHTMATPAVGVLQECCMVSRAMAGRPHARDPRHGRK